MQNRLIALGLLCLWPLLTPALAQNAVTIPTLKAGSYPGSAIITERSLKNASNYRQMVVSYRSEGLKIYALMTIPLAKAPKNGWPVIVFNHGYIPPAQYRTTERYTAYVAGFARAGYIVFKPDYRGHGQSQGQSGGAYWSPDYTIDVLNAVSSVAKHPGANASRIGMWGHSMGGYLTLRSLVIDKRVKVGVIWAGVVAPQADLFGRWNRSGPIPAQALSRRQQFIKKYGSIEENPTLYRELSANNYLTGIGPVQIHHGLADVVVPVAFSRTLASNLRAAKQSYQSYEYPGNDHNLSQSFSLAMRRSVAYFDRYLK
jgi:uncharacterized protein